MLVVSDKASEEIQKVFAQPQAKGNNLIIYFQGMGWGGPSLGMALEESVDGLEELEANGVTAYIDPNLKSFLNQFGQVNVDYVDNGLGSRGFTVRVGAGTSGCSSCGSDSGCSWFAFSNLPEFDKPAFGPAFLLPSGGGISAEIKRLDEVDIFDTFGLLDAGVAQFG